MKRVSVRAVLAIVTGTLVAFGMAKANPENVLRKQSSHNRNGERRIVEPNRRAIAAVESLTAQALGDVSVTWNDRGVVQGVYGKIANYGGASESEARIALATASDLFSLRADLSDLSLVSERETPGGRLLDFQQDYQGVKVYNGVVSVVFDNDGDVSAMTGNYFDTIALDDVTPSVSVDDARATLLTRVRRAGDAEPILKELVVYVGANQRAHLAYHIIQPTSNRKGAAETYETFVDAHTGAILVAPHDVNQYANGQVYKNGNAMAATGNSSLKDSSSVPSSAYQTVTLQGLQSSSGLVGQYVDCYTNTSSGNRATPDGSGNYVFTRSTTVSTGSKFDAVNLYYYVDDAQRYIQSLGFTNVNNRRVLFAVNGTTDDNSWYTPNGSGTGSLTTGSGGVDDAEDGEVMLHEYGHSIQDNSRPGAWNGAQAGAMGEGFGDYWAASVTSQRHNQRGTAYETTVMEWDASSYSSAVPPTIRSITSTKHYPENVAGEVHDDGEMWSSTLWQIRSDFIALDGWPAGAQNCDKVVLQSHFLVPASSPSFADGSNALIQAATNLGFNTAHVDAIRNRCSARGFISSGGGGGGGGGTGTIGCGDSINGSLATSDGRSPSRGSSYYADLYTLEGTAGTQVTITMNSSAFDCYLYLRNGSGVVASNDDGNGGTNSKIVYTIPADGTYTVDATSYSTNATGSYTLALSCSGGGGGGGGGGPVTVLSEGAESGASGWTTSSNITGNNWVVSTAGRRTGSNGFRSNQASSAYPNNLDQSLTSPAFSLSGTSSATLTFYYKQQTETNYDYFKVEISTNGGSSWTSLSNTSGNSSGFTTTAGSGMVSKSISLNSYAGQANVMIRFRLTSDYSVTKWGVALDDIAVTAQ